MPFFKSILLSALALLATSCATLDPSPPKTPSQAAMPTSAGPLSMASQEATQKCASDESAFYLLKGSTEALEWRLALIDSATSSIDFQYYLWDHDESGKLVLTRLIDAADRGVRVRFILDDLLVGSMEEILSALAHHPNFEVRLFNVRLNRKGVVGPLMEVASDFERLNQRMHNKLVIADGHFAIHGGRNIGNTYFGLGEKYNFLDLDVIATGAIMPEVCAAFDEYWNSEAAYPGKAISPDLTPDEAAVLVAEYREAFQAAPGVLADSTFPLEQQDWSSYFASFVSKWHTGTGVVAQDSPDLTPNPQRRFLDHAPSLVDPHSPEIFTYVSPYLLPGENTYQSLSRLSEKGANVNLLTCGLDSTNHTIVHSHYKRHRSRLLATGSHLYEFKTQPTAEIRALADTAPVKSKRIALHVKGGVGDNGKCYLGSLNIDPRSVILNTENGLIIDSPSLAREVTEYFELLMHSSNAWKVQDNAFGAPYWESDEGRTAIQPSNGVARRLGDIFFGFFLLEGQL